MEKFHVSFILMEMNIKSLQDQLSQEIESNHVTKEDVSATVERTTGVGKTACI